MSLFLLGKAGGEKGKSGSKRGGEKVGCERDGQIRNTAPLPSKPI